MTVGKRISKRRKELGMTAQELADIIGKNRATVYRYESGDIEDLPVSVIGPIANALMVTPEYLIRGEEEKTIDIITQLHEWKTAAAEGRLMIDGEKIDEVGMVKLEAFIQFVMADITK